MKHKQRVVVYATGHDPKSRAKCNGNHLVFCPQHHPDVYPSRAKHRGYYHDEMDLV